MKNLPFKFIETKARAKNKYNLPQNRKKLLKKYEDDLDPKNEDDLSKKKDKTTTPKNEKYHTQKMKTISPKI